MQHNRQVDLPAKIHDAVHPAVQLGVLFAFKDVAAARQAALAGHLQLGADIVHVWHVQVADKHLVLGQHHQVAHGARQVVEWRHEKCLALRCAKVDALHIGRLVQICHSATHRAAHIGSVVVDVERGPVWPVCEVWLVGLVCRVNWNWQHQQHAVACQAANQVAAYPAGRKNVVGNQARINAATG